VETSARRRAEAPEDEGDVIILRNQTVFVSPLSKQQAAANHFVTTEAQFLRPLCLAGNIYII